ncbi:hypothetical protein [Rhodococcus sp. X156]|uniref:hypothetical protein n=1 Tax=Rhodococcus sp. X156 TaxID=2499145 RepID=UPI000FD7E979|nr:hypothetical protein [Rhodococcus sp. X156]
MTHTAPAPSTPQDETPPVEAPVEGAVADTDTPGPETPTEDTGEEAKPGREAARYRRQLREAEAERDALRDQLTAAHKQIVEDAAGLTKPAALWAAGITVDELFTDGHLDTDALTTAVTTAADALGLTRVPRTPKADPSQGSHGVGAAPTGRAAWDSALRS